MLLSIAILPIGMISILQTLHLSREAERSSEIAIQGRTAAAAAGERALLQGAIGTADALGSSVLTLLDDPAACSEMMRDFVQRSATFVYAGFTDITGRNACSSADRVVDMRDLPHFLQFMREPGTLITAAEKGRASGQSVVIVSQPLYREQDLLGYVAVSLSHDLLRSTHATAYWSDGARILTFNSVGQSLVGDFESDNDPTAILPEGMTLDSLIPLTDTTFSGISNSGEQRVFSVVAVVPDLVYALGSWSPQLTGIAGLTVSRLAAVLFPVALWAVSLAVAYFAVYRLVLRHVRELRSQMRRFALGNRDAPPPILEGAPGEIRDVSETFHNMARILIRDEAAMEEVVAEKTVLLKEVHHRVKNNLQLIASIINMQGRMIDDTDAKRVLRSVQDRVASLATIYKNLYQAEHLDSVEADRLIRDIIGQMSTATVVNDQSIQIDTRLDPLVLLPDQAVPLTLLTTEAFTNALKYAGKAEGQERAWVRVQLRVDDEGKAELTIENSLGQPLNNLEGTGLGSQLIEAFAMQLDTETEVTATDDVFTLHMRFSPDAPYSLREPEERRVVLTSAAREGARH
ncbi:histidine kinase [Paracoccus sp. MC1862]|nr:MULTISPECIES: histidine kinase dimerization/phosphoacceptor domain -containing protein [unclassified Paracoccus (in: a-proteobacteria)]MBB1492058.1 histidine kinase [Paracoccus sp. MC1854]MBB1497944.1 histidine kinase [Paracoccus sp. MC1862]QQO46482.1 histidine kinase [Paracoccus sp. MC1862]